MKLQAHLTWSPGGTPEMPYALLEPRDKEVEVLGGFKLRSNVVVLVISVEGPDESPYDNVSERTFGRYPYPLSRWVDDAMATLDPGETKKVRGRIVTRMTDDEIKALEPITVTHENYH